VVLPRDAAEVAVAGAQLLDRAARGVGGVAAGRAGAVVLAVEHVVVVEVLVAGVAGAVLIPVRLVRVVGQRAVVDVVGRAVVVVVGVAGVALAVRVEVGLIGVRVPGAVVDVAADPVELEIVVGIRRAHIDVVGDPITVLVLERVADVADTVVVDVALVGVDTSGQLSAASGKTWSLSSSPSQASPMPSPSLSS
jgi:hypothetical protein